MGWQLSQELAILRFFTLQRHIGFTKGLLSPELTLRISAKTL